MSSLQFFCKQHFKTNFDSILDGSRNFTLYRPHENSVNDPNPQSYQSELQLYNTLNSLSITSHQLHVFTGNPPFFDLEFSCRFQFPNKKFIELHCISFRSPPIVQIKLSFNKTFIDSYFALLEYFNENIHYFYNETGIEFHNLIILEILNYLPNSDYNHIDSKTKKSKQTILKSTCIDIFNGGDLINELSRSCETTGIIKYNKTNLNYIKNSYNLNDNIINGILFGLNQMLNNDLWNKYCEEYVKEKEKFFLVKGGIVDVKINERDRTKWTDGTIAKVSQNKVLIHVPGFGTFWFDKNSKSIAKEGTMKPMEPFHSFFH